MISVGDKGGKKYFITIFHHLITKSKSLKNPRVFHLIKLCNFVQPFASNVTIKLNALIPGIVLLKDSAQGESKYS
jgi:hypothetical protein